MRRINADLSYVIAGSATTNRPHRAGIFQSTADQALPRRFKFSTWIYKIAHNSAVDHLRRNSTREQSLVLGTEGDQFDLPLESGRLSPEQESERKERRVEIESVVRALPANYRELIILRHSQDLSYEEIVEYGLPLGTVKNRFPRARDMRQMVVERDSRRVMTRWHARKYLPQDLIAAYSTVRWKRMSHCFLRAVEVCVSCREDCELIVSSLGT